MRRPAAAPKRARVRARPAAVDLDDGEWEKASEVNIRELNSWPAVYIQGLYWDNNAEVIGEVKTLEIGEDGTMLTFKAHGTTSEEVLRLLSGKSSKLLQVHLCDDPHVYEDARMTMIGNSWHVGVVAWLIGRLTLQLGVASPLALQEIVEALTPGSARDFPSMLVRPPHQGRLGKAAMGAEERLVAKCLGLASTKGEDLLVHAASDPAPRYFRLRASVPGRLWQWREISGWRWKLAGEHINLLELRAIFTSVKWKVSRSKKLGVRFLHLTDSLVCLHALTRSEFEPQVETNPDEAECIAVGG